MLSNITSLSCTGCMSCVQACPVNAIVVTQDQAGFFLPAIKQSICLGCNLCDKICPVNNENESYTPYAAFSLVNKEEGVREKSSSGGAFRSLAVKILEKGGVVFGCCFNPENKTFYHASTDEVPLERLQRSKYIESAIGDSYKKAKTELEKGRYVLFAGTPCQIAGLNSSLIREVNSLKIC